MTDEAHRSRFTNIQGREGPFLAGLCVLGLLLVIYWKSFQIMVTNWRMIDSYYSHGFLIPPICLFLAWKQRETILKISPAPYPWGYAVIAAACTMLLLGDYLGFRVFAQLSLIPMFAGLMLVFLGKRYLAVLWFPLAFLIFMIPIPVSMTQSIILNVKLFATEAAVQLAQLMTIPMIRDGSFVHFKDDSLLVGEVCGGLRSLIALLAFGALMAHISKTRTWAKCAIFAISAPIAVISNVLRILFLCLVGYFYGSESAVGSIHDVSAILIFAVAFLLLFSIESFLRRVAPAPAGNGGGS